MDKTSVFSYYAFGYNYHIVRSIEANSDKVDAIIKIKEHLNNLQNINLAITLKIFKNRCERLIHKIEKAEGDKFLPEHEKELTEIIDEADAAMDAELSLKMVLSVTQKRFDTESLLEEPKNLLAENVWGFMSDQAKLDFSEATKCIAMNLPTSSAFHLMRAVEETLKQLYFHFVKRNRLAKPMWGPMVNKLNAKNNPKPRKETLDMLDMIRLNYRNPTQHPEKNYSIDEAQDLLNNSIVAINCIYRDIHPIHHNL
ncbi:hypothetical protein SJ090_12065 [Enterobacter cloacae]|uniref:hypothetical protein n=1 Tax=Enterobacter cloacae TaxID=550 RepID=UPI0029DB2490|nr:hypothetical protein [Enterobacter cloacae]MDX7021993.1 hypothetical protein [Enterobacter cloacae]